MPRGDMGRRAACQDWGVSAELHVGEACPDNNSLCAAIISLLLLQVNCKTIYKPWGIEGNGGKVRTLTLHWLRFRAAEISHNGERKRELNNRREKQKQIACSHSLSPDTVKEGSLGLGTSLCWGKVTGQFWKVTDLWTFLFFGGHSHLLSSTTQPVLAGLILTSKSHGRRGVNSYPSGQSLSPIVSWPGKTPKEEHRLVSLMDYGSEGP